MIRTIVICVLMISLLFISACSGPAEEPLTRSSSELLTSDASLLELIIIDDIKSYVLDPSYFTHNIELKYDVEQIEVIATPEDMIAIVVVNGTPLVSNDPNIVILNPP